MNRTSELKKYYYQCEKARILEKHGELLKTVNTTALSNESCRESVKIYLTTWLDFLIECWHKEVSLDFKFILTNRFLYFVGAKLEPMVQADIRRIFSRNCYQLIHQMHRRVQQELFQASSRFEI
jgi:hypothetical protein